MSLSIVELFGHAPEDRTVECLRLREAEECPFVGGKCIKRLKSGLTSGVCTVKLASSDPVICCPNRMYSEEYKVLLDVAVDAFGAGAHLCRNLAGLKGDGLDVMVFGKRWGKELRLPSRAYGGRYFVDWVLALLGPEGELKMFVAVEVQTVDTTGSYEAQVRRHLYGDNSMPDKPSGINWENVSKRILPQIIFKGHVLRHEPLCAKGLYFLCPAAVRKRIMDRLGGGLSEYHQQPGALTFRWYDVAEANAASGRRPLELKGHMTTTVDQVALAFTSPSNLPAPGVYEQAIREELRPKSA